VVICVVPDFLNLEQSTPHLDNATIVPFERPTIALLDRNINSGLYTTLGYDPQAVRAVVEAKFDVSVKADNGFAIQAYGVGDGIRPHVDNVISPKYVGTSNPQRLRDITSVLFLNDNFDGGVLEFGDLGIRVQPKQGTLVVFSSTYEHEVTKVASGRRFVVAQFWIKV
jgi:hypothetical protein